MNWDAPAEPSREDLLALISAQAAQIAALTARIAELERRLGLDSSNSGKPPSSDGLKKPARVRNLREPSGKPPGGQKGHPGETLRQVQMPDVIVDHYPQACGRCGSALTTAMATGHSARQVFDLPEPRPLVVTEHRAHACCCTSCGARTKADVPDRSGGAGSIRSAHQRHCGLSAARPFPAGRSVGRADARSVRGEPRSGDHRSDEPQLCRAAAELRPSRVRSCGRRTSQASGRDRLSHRRANPMAAYRLHGPAHLLSGLRPARHRLGQRYRHRGA